MKFSIPLLVFTLTLILCSSLLIAAKESAENKNNDNKEKTNVDSLSMSLSSFSSSSHLSNKRKHTTLVMSDNNNAANGDNEEKELMRQEMKRLQLERAIHRFESNKKRRQAEQQSHSNNNSNSNSNSNNNEEEEEEKDFLIPYPGKDSEHGLHESHPRAIGKRREMIARSGGTFETFAASTRKGIPPVMKYAEDTVFSTQKLVPAHISYADDPLNTFSIVEPVNGCSNTTNNRELTSVTAKYRQCLIAGNAGFFKVSTGACHGNLISDSKVVQNTGRQNVNFGIQKDGTITVGYLLSDDIVQAERDGNPFVQLIAGVIWLVRNGEIYVTESAAMEDMSVQETGSRFVDIVSGRAALGHDVYGRVVLYQVDGHSDRRGINLYELAELLVDRGVYNAINLDGGGSMTSVWNGTVVSYPSDNCPSEPFKCERKVTTIVCLHDLRCNPTNCSGHGTCIGSTPATAEAGTAGTCDCDFGWRPPNCSIPVNPCEDADYFEYVDWYKSTHNITSSSSSDPYSGGGNGGSGGGFVPDNDRKRRADTNSTASLTSTKSSTPTSTQSSTSKLTPSSSLASSASLTSQSSSLQSSSLSSSQSSTSSTTSSRSPTTSSRSPSPSLSPSPSPSPKVYPLTPGGCHVNATCSTTGPGKHVCSCKPGYYGNGTFCIQLPQPCPTAVSSSLYFSTSSVSSSSLASSTSILATTTVATATATTTAAVAAFDDSGGLINPECLPYAYWLIAIAIIALVAIAICLWALVSNSKKYKKLAFGIPSNEAREESLLEFQNQLTNQSNRSAQPVTRTYSNRGINGHNNSNNNNNGSSNIQNNNNNNNNSEIQSSNNAFIIADDNLNNNNNSDDYLSQEYSPSIEDEQTSKGAGISMKTFVKGLVSTTSKISKKSLGSGPPFSELSGEDSDEKHIINDVDVFGDDDL